MCRCWVPSSDRKENLADSLTAGFHVHHKLKPRREMSSSALLQCCCCCCCCSKTCTLPLSDFFFSQQLSSDLLYFCVLDSKAGVIDLYSALSHLHSEGTKQIHSWLWPKIGLLCHSNSITTCVILFLDFQMKAGKNVSALRCCQATVATNGGLTHGLDHVLLDERNLFKPAPDRAGAWMQRLSWAALSVKLCVCVYILSRPCFFIGLFKGCDI